MSQQYERTVEDVTKMLFWAKQKDCEINPISQIFYYPKKSVCKERKGNLRLMAIDEEFIKQLENGERFFIKGSNDEKVVFCTDYETYEIKEGETSNSLIIAPNLLFNSDLKDININERTLKEHKVYGVHHTYLELKLTFPRVFKLKKILQEAEFSKSTEAVENFENGGYYFYELLDIIQCSRKELLQYLGELKAICFKDKWRVLSLEYIIEIFSEIKCYMEENDRTKINALEIKKYLCEVPNYIVDHILQYYMTPVIANDNLFEFKEDSIARCCAELLLKTAEKSFRFNDFMKTWKCYLHPVVNANLSHLAGLALIEKDITGETAISLFPENELPENVAERFRLLFKKKEKWTLNELTPYIEKLTTKNMNITTLLTKHTRSSHVNGIKVFTAKYAK